MPRVAAFLWIALAAHASEIAAIWAVNDGEKVDRDDLSNPNKPDNSAWDGERVRLFAARNEIVSFQLIVESGEEGIRGLAVSLPGFQQRGGVAVIEYVTPAEDPTGYRGRPIQVFVEHYMRVAQATSASWIYIPNSVSAPRSPLGWKPVQLVPGNALLGGFPLDVPPLSNQPVWFDIYPRRDLPAGFYDGTITVRAGETVRTIPVSLEVFDVTLPDRNSMNAMVYYEPSQPQLYMGRNFDAAFHRFAHRNRIELVHAYSESSVEAVIERFRGGDFTAEYGYEGPGEGVGNRIAPLTFYGPGAAFDARETAWRRSDDWVTFLDRMLPGAVTFLYLPDEPAPDQFPRIRSIAANVKSNPGPGRRLPLFVTHAYTPDLDGAIDIWCSTPRGYDPDRAMAERAEGRDYWFYNGGRPSGPAIVIDAPATDARVLAWACFRHNIGTYFYWHSVHWLHNTQKPADRLQNVWANPITYDNRGRGGNPGGSFANGDGVLIYPGLETQHPEENRGIAGPISTVQLANLRRGLQDHLYLTLAREAGLGGLVEEALNTVVPRVLGNVGSNAATPVGFAETGNEFEAMRYKLAQALAGRQ